MPPYRNSDGAFISKVEAKQFFRRIRSFTRTRGERKIFYGGWVENKDNIICIIDTYKNEEVTKKILSDNPIKELLEYFNLYAIIDKETLDIHIKSDIVDLQTYTRSKNEEEEYLKVNDNNDKHEEGESVSELLEKSRLLREKDILNKTAFYKFYKDFKIKTKHEKERNQIMAYYLAEEYTEDIKKEVNILCNLRTTINAINEYNKQKELIIY